MWRSIHDAWWRLATQSHPRSISDVLASGVLQAAAACYHTGIAFRNATYTRGWVQPIQLPVPVISVGNLTLGGAGKTACVELVVKKLLARGARAVVLTRGYGGGRRSYVLQWQEGQLQVDGVPWDRAVTSDVADEPQLLAMRLPGVPVIVDRERARGGRLAIDRFGATVLVLDDGFQHRQLARDCDIVLVHARTPLGGWLLFPRGPMREPLGALTRAHVAIVTKISESLETANALAERLQMVNPALEVLTSEHLPVDLIDRQGATHPLSALASTRVGLVSSIGDPEGFEAMVRRLGAGVAWHRKFPDHHAYQRSDVALITQEAASSHAEAILTTEKDWVRLARVWDTHTTAVPWWALRIKMQIVNGDTALDDRLARLRAR